MKIDWISGITLKPDRFSCSHKIQLKQDPPAHGTYMSNYTSIVVYIQI